MKDLLKRPVSRRRFIQGSAAVAGALSIGGPRLAFGQETPTDGGTLRIAFTGLQQLDPYKTQGNNDESNACSLIFDPLVMLSKDAFATKPYLASSWEQPDELTWRFHLRQGVMFQDDNAVFAAGQGRELVADDVVYSFNRYMDLALNASLGDIESVTAVDAYTVDVRMGAPNPFFLVDPNGIPSLGIVPHEGIEKLGEDGFAQQPVGSGPFKLTSFKPNQELTFERNEQYWLPVHLDGVQFLYIPDPTVQTISLQGGRIDVIPYLFNLDSARELSQTPDITLLGRGGSYRGFGFNVQTAPFDERAVRDAISKAMDIDGAINAVVSPFGERAYGQVPPWVPFGHDPSLADLWSYDPDAALKELADAGFTEKNADGILTRGGTPLSFQLKVIPGSQVRVFTILVTQLKQLGIDAQILQQDVATWADDLLAGNTGMFFDFSYAGTKGLYQLFGGDNIGLSNTHFYANAEVDALFQQAITTSDQDELSRLWKEAQRLIMEDRVGIPLYFEEGFAIVSDRVHDFVPPWGGLRLVSPENNVYIS